MPQKFILSPGWERAEKVRICYADGKPNDDDKKVSQDAVDLYLVDGAIFVQFLQAAWTYHLINYMLDDTSNCTKSSLPDGNGSEVGSYYRYFSSDGACYYEWVLRKIRLVPILGSTTNQSSIYCVKNISKWVKHDHSFRALLWKDNLILIWLCQQTAWTASTLKSESKDAVIHGNQAFASKHQNNLNTLLDALNSIFETADSVTVWQRAQPSIANIVNILNDALTTDNVVNKIVDGFSAVLFSIMWLPHCDNIKQTPVTAITEAILQLPEWEMPCKVMMQRCLDLLKIGPLEPLEMAILFKSMNVLKQIINHTKHQCILLFIQRDFLEYFRYCMSQVKIICRYQSKSVLDSQIILLIQDLKYLVCKKM